MGKTPFATDGRSKIQQAMAWLQNAMGGQERPAAEIEAAAIAEGYTHSTLATARTRLGIRSQRKGNAWVWIPPRSARKKQPVSH